MDAYIARHKDAYPLSLLEDLRKEAVYGCSDPRLHPRVREQVDRRSIDRGSRETVGRWLPDSFFVLTDYVEQHGVLP